MGSTRHALIPLLVLAAVCSFEGEACAQSTIQELGERPHYAFEAEPHAVLGPFNPPGATGGQGFGLGFRGTLNLVFDGFVASINDSVGIGFGADWTHYDSDTGKPGDDLNIPVVMQWNFWLHRKWSVFGEPGISLYLTDFDKLGFNPFALYLGGRFQLAERIALTMRVGYPTCSVGVSFFL